VHHASQGCALEACKWTLGVLALQRMCTFFCVPSSARRDFPGVACGPSDNRCSCVTVALSGAEDVTPAAADDDDDEAEPSGDAAIADTGRAEEPSDGPTDEDMESPTAAALAEAEETDQPAAGEGPKRGRGRGGRGAGRGRGRGRGRGKGRKTVEAGGVPLRPE